MPVSPTALVVAAGPDAPGARALLEGLASRSARVLLTGAGLAWLAAPADLALLRSAAQDLALCSQSAREHGWDAHGTPAGVRWSSLGVWMVEQHGRPFVWVAP